MSHQATPGESEWRLAGLPPTATSVRTARLFVADALRPTVEESLLHDAALAVSELVTNAVVHAGTPMDVVVRVDAGGVWVEVSDESQRLPRSGGDVPLPHAGQGLRLLDALAADWGAELRPVGKAVWFRLTP